MSLCLSSPPQPPPPTTHRPPPKGPRFLAASRLCSSLPFPVRAVLPAHCHSQVRHPGLDGACRGWDRRPSLSSAPGNRISQIPWRLAASCLYRLANSHPAPQGPAQHPDIACATADADADADANCKLRPSWPARASPGSASIAAAEWALQTGLPDSMPLEGRGKRAAGRDWPSVALTSSRDP